MKKIYSITLAVVVLLVSFFVWYLCDLAHCYHEGIILVTQGEYEKAAEIFTQLDGYQDSEVLAEYCDVMAEYDAFDYASVFRSYNDLRDLVIENEALEVEVAATRAEISVRYEIIGNYEYGRPMVAPTEYYGGEGVG